MASLIQKIGRLSVQAFNRDPSSCSQTKKTYLRQLKDLVSSVSSADLALDPALLQDNMSQNGNIASLTSNTQAPVIYLLIYEDADVNICVFILRKGVRMPMHDHPGMHGLLKVVHGCIKVQSYTPLEQPNPPGLRPAVKHPPVIRNADQPPLSLCPNEENIHEIMSLDGPAAFLDILSPPYGLDTREGSDRDCHYYEQLGLVNDLDTSKVWLTRIPSPSEFWCDQAQYQGPPLTGVIERGRLWRRYNRRKKPSQSNKKT